MASETGRKASDLIALLRAEPQCFTLDQALRLLGQTYAQTPEGAEAFIRQNVYVRPWLSLAFPASELVAAGQEGADRWLLTATGFGLYSTLGPLPTFYTEDLLEEERNDESIMRDFLDIINNHLFRLMYAAGHHNRLERRTVESHRRDAAHIQFCLMGESAPPLRDSEQPRAVLAELLTSRTRSASQLESFLCHMLNRDDVKVEQCVERKVLINADQQCRLGLSAHALGQDAVIGCQVRDSTGRFRLHLLSASAHDMRRFLPGQPEHTGLIRSIGHFLDAPLEYELVLHPGQDAAPQRSLGTDSGMGFYLGACPAYPPVTIFWRHFQPGI
ncbi:MAG: type VI secretion system baseplate subunit TssG [Desulfovibrionaceae bacterium]|nr:type VI secretion system baseplate subunit TssG [Desulfovibrionaceae bacterium]